MRRGFTLIELLVIVGIIAAMAGVGIANVRAGQGAARVKGATRDIFAAIRQARSQALVSQKPVVLVYENVEVDGEPMAKISLESAKLFSKGVDRASIRTITGKPLPPIKEELVHVEKVSAAVEAEKEEEGTLISDVLFAPISEDVVKGMRIKVDVGEEDLSTTQARRPKVSVFSNVDYILGKYREKESAKKSEETKKSSEEGKTDSAASAEMQGPVQVVWETNGRVDPHRVWIYADGQKPEDGLLIKIDRFGAAKVLNGDGRGDDE